MEIVVEKVTIKKEEKELCLSTKLSSDELIGIYGKEKDLLASLLALMIKPQKGKVHYDDQTKKKLTREAMKRKIAYLPYRDNYLFHKKTMKEEIDYWNHTYYNKEEKISIDQDELLKMVGLDSSLLDEPFSEMSNSKAKLVQLAIVLLYNPKVIILEEPMRNLDLAIQKQLLDLFKQLKEKYHKMIIIATDDVNFLYTQMEKVLILKDGEKLLEGTPEEVFTETSLLEEKEIDIPDLVKFTAKARKTKKVKLHYHKDVRDLIKDIYKHVDFTKK